MSKLWKLTDGEKYLCGILSEGILMMDSPDQNDLVILNENQIESSIGSSFIDELTSKEVFFDNLIRVEIGDCS